jgi:hypothetical protein
MAVTFHITPAGQEASGRCACCGHESRKVWGEVATDDAACAVYFVHWTVGHIRDHGAHFDIILGSWGDDTSPADRTVALLEHRLLDNGPAVMVIDAKLERGLEGVAANALTRAEVIGTPIADNLFAIYDAIVLQDPRVTALVMEDDDEDIAEN